MLVVDDELNMARAIRRACERAGFETEHVTSGFDAGVYLDRYTPDVITLDVGMEGIGGDEVLACVRAMERFKDVKVLLVSGLSRERLEEVLARGADDYLQKPFDNETLIEKITWLAGA